MEDDMITNIWSFSGGAILGITGYLLKVDWSSFFEQLGPESIKVGLLGIIGGAGGLLGKKIVEKNFFKRKRK